MTATELYGQIREKGSFLCVGLDTDLDRIPKELLTTQDPIFEFNKAIVDATAPFTVAYKPNLAFYECHGAKGWNSLEKTVNYIRNNYPQQFIIADAKRGDIGNTSQMYAKTFFQLMDFDAVTLSPYMGKDTVEPFLNFDNKWVILLALTSNQSFNDFQLEYNQETKKHLFETVIEKSKQWGTENNTMYVVGATRAEMLIKVREHAPNHFLLIPGVGAQGGSLEEVAKYGFNNQCGLLVNSSRGILYADNGPDFAKASAEAAKELRNLMTQLLKQSNLL